LSTIHDCPRRWFLTYQCGLPDPSGTAAIVGTAAHAGVEFHEKQRMMQKAVDLDEMTEVAHQALPSDATEEMQESVRHALRHWWRTPMKKAEDARSHRDWLLTMDPIAIEPYFKVTLVDGALPIAGWVDGIYWDPEVKLYRLVDLKTAGSMSRWKDSGDGKRHQATLYAIALQLSDVLPESIDYLPCMTYTIVKPGIGGECSKRVNVQPDLADVAVLGQKIRDAEVMVQEDRFPRNPSWNLCSQTWCPHYTRCMVTGELAGDPVAVRVKLGVPNPGSPEVQS
jgi:hypothetical protein